MGLDEPGACGRGGRSNSRPRQNFGCAPARVAGKDGGGRGYVLADRSGHYTPTSLIWALRKGAPTNLMRTGAIAGLVAGALGAAVFAFHHPGGSIPFIALWYGGSILLCALVGAILGSRLLRW
jgi:hypothetical protein